MAPTNEVEIGDLLNRRSDLSTFLVHLTKGDDPKAALESILADQAIDARSAMGWAKNEAEAFGRSAERSQRVVCFSETPLDQIYTMFADIARREVKLKPYGLAFTKMVARRKGAQPVWYVNMTRGYTWTVTPALNELRDAACAGSASEFIAHPASKIFPYFEPTGTWPESQREFWWEREWRHRRTFAFDMSEIALVLAPEADHATFEALVPGKCIDPAWSLERMIAKLVGLGPQDVSPFTSV